MSQSLTRAMYLNFCTLFLDRFSKEIKSVVSATYQTKKALKLFLLFFFIQMTALSHFERKKKKIFSFAREWGERNQK